jgi:hypothetical protein
MAVLHRKLAEASPEFATRIAWTRCGFENDQEGISVLHAPLAHAGKVQNMESSRLPWRANEFDIETEFSVVLEQRKGEGENHEREAMPDR